MLIVLKKYASTICLQIVSMYQFFGVNFYICLHLSYIKLTQKCYWTTWDT